MLADTSWVWRQYDHLLFLNTVVGPGGDATVLRLKHPVTGEDTGRALALTTDGNHRWCAVDPRDRHGVGRGRVGARTWPASVPGPLAVVNCLNFGNPEHPEVMWELSEAIDGMAEACRDLDLPVVGGNVSLYNESARDRHRPDAGRRRARRRRRLSRRPPGIGPGRRRRPAARRTRAGDAGSLAGSRWAWETGRPGRVVAAARSGGPPRGGGVRAGAGGRRIWWPRCTTWPTAAWRWRWPKQRWPARWARR